MTVGVRTQISPTPSDAGSRMSSSTPGRTRHAPSNAPIRTLIFSGQNNHGWRTTTPYLQKLLTDSGRFDVRLEEAPAGITKATLADQDLIVVDYQGPRWGPAAEKVGI